ncbi:MAG: hypothetical protein IJ721_08315 [Bacteroidales bacterium]|nr:hypothetical protein [Bacteroidales bacterium]
MKRFFVITALMVLGTGLRAADGTDRLLHRLDEALAMKETYASYLEQRVGMLRQMLDGRNTLAQTYEIDKRIAEEYSSYSMDSTVAYLEWNRIVARELGDPVRQAEADFLLAQQWGVGGNYSEALDLLAGYRLETVPPEMEFLYYEVSNYIYGELSAYSSGNPQYWQKRDMYRVAMLRMMEEGTYEWYDQQRAQAEADRDREGALSWALKALEATTPRSRQYARAAFFVSTYQTDDEQELVWLARSALADVMCGTRDYASLNDLAALLYRRGDIDRAFRYAADHCMPDALFFNGRLRPWQIAQFFPSLEQAYAAKSARSTRVLRLMVGLALLLLGALAALVWFLFHRQALLVRTRKELEASTVSVGRRNQELLDMNARLTALNGELQEANKVRQEYIALFLQNLSGNISTTRQYKNHVLKYIRRGNDKYLVEEIEALPPLEHDIQEFNKMFDETFAGLYPDFVEKFNALLADGEAIVPKGEDILTPELRVFALIKLGISESSKIASLLHYSTTTVYNYRSKTKSKARGDRDLFEDAVRAIE